VPDIQRKKLDTCIQNHGESTPSKTKAVKEKTKQTNLVRYGTISPSQNDTVKTKQRRSQKSAFYSDIIFGNRLPFNITPLFSREQYLDNSRSSEYKFKCNDCGATFFDHLANGRIPRCFGCFPTQSAAVSSKYEQEIYDFIISIYSNPVIRNSYQVISPTEIDIFIPGKNIAIEFNGLYWHSELSGKKDRNYHLNKTNSCEKKGVQLFHIFEDEWVTKKDIMKAKLSSLLCSSTNRVFARKCEVREVPTNIKNDFLANNHIQGSDKSSVKLGLFHMNELQAVMTFCNIRLPLNRHNMSNKQVFELSRYATNCQVVGGAGKLLAYFIKNFSVEKIETYADRRFSCGNLYKQLGFTQTKTTGPSYWFLNKRYCEREYRFKYAKHVMSSKVELFDPELSEWQNMQLNGYDRIWDCGHLKYELVVV